MRSNYSVVISGLFCAVAAMAGQTASGQSISNASFEAPAYSAEALYPAPSASASSWVFQGTSGIRYFALANGGNGRQAAYLSANGTTASLGRITQTVHLNPGKYQVRYVAARPLGELTTENPSPPVPNPQNDGGTVQPVQFHFGPAAEQVAALGGAIWPRFGMPPAAPGGGDETSSAIAENYPGGKARKQRAPSDASRSKDLVTDFGLSAFETWWTETFEVTVAGAYSLGFAATDPTLTLAGGTVTYIDDVTIVRVPTMLSNGGFESAIGASPASWSLAGNAAHIISGPVGGSEGYRSVVMGVGSVAQYTYLPAGRYSVSARIRFWSDTTSVSCPVTISSTIGGVTTVVGTLPSTPSTHFVPVTSEPFDLVAGMHDIKLACASAGYYVYLDAVTINSMAPAFANSSFETPYAGNSGASGYRPPGYFDTSTGPYIDAPSGSSWAFSSGQTTNAGVMGNGVGWPQTFEGSQFAYLSAAGSWVEQSVSLPKGSYVLLYGAGADNSGTSSVAVKVGGTTVSSAELHPQQLTIGMDMSLSQRMTPVFRVEAAGSYAIRFEGQGTLIDLPRILMVNSSPSPQVEITTPAIAAGKPYALVQGPGPASVSFAATASDPGGLAANSLKLFIDNMQVGTSTSTSPFSTALTGLASGTYVLEALATNTGGAEGGAARLLKVNSPPAGGITVTNAGVNHVAVGQTVPVTVTAAPTDADGSVTQVEFLMDGSTIAGCTRASAPWSCSLTLSARSSDYLLTARVTDNDGGVTTYPATSVTVNTKPSVAMTLPSSGASFLSPAVITLSATASDSDGSIGKVEFFKSATVFDASTLIATVNTGQAGTAGPPSQPTQSGNTYVFNWAVATAGTYVLSARATDNRGGTTVSTPAVTIAVMTQSSTNLIIAPASTSAYGVTRTLTATVTPNPATGVVTFYDGVTAICSGVALATVGSDKVATCTFNTGNAGNHTFNATYGGDTTFASSGGSVSHVITKAVTSVAVSAVPAAPTVGQAVALTATIAPSSATGSVDFKEGGTTICATVPLSGTTTKTASCNVPGGSVTNGTHTYTASYGGDANHDAGIGSTAVVATFDPRPLLGGVINMTSTNGGRAVVGSAYTLRVPATDSDNLSVSVTGVSSPTSSCSGSGSNKFCDVTWTPQATGVQSIAITVTDSHGGSSTTRTTVAVQQAPAAEDVSTDGTTALVGKVAGSLSVSDGGTAQYNVPIQVPPGVNGLQPNLALTYSSGGGYGTMGLGWSLAGLGAITRCPTTIAQDGFRAALNYDNQEANDAYCLGGQRLVPTSDLVSAGNITITYKPPTNLTLTVAAKKQTFRTEVEGYARITGYKEWPNFTAGFSRFLVETKDGRIMHYSRRFKPMSNGYDACREPTNPLSCTNGVSASRVKMFVLDRIEDVAGNRIDIEYHTTRPTATGENTYVVDWDAIGTIGGTNVMDVGGNGSYPPTEILPKVIKYASGHEVLFKYDEHPLSAQLRTFDSGAGESVVTQRLVGVEIWADGGLKKRYALGYDSSTVTPPALPTSFSPTGRTRLVSIKECHGALDNTCLPATTFEWQGDTVSSLLNIDSPVNESSYTFLGSRQLIGDIRGNGRSSLILTDYNSSGTLSGHLRVCNLTGATSSVAGAFACTDQYIQTPTTLNTEGNTYLADVNGDGKADLVYGNAVQGDHYVCLAKSDGTGFSSNSGAPTPCSAPIMLGRTVNNGLMQADFNGDGRIDILVYRNVADYVVADPAGTLRHKFDLYLGTSAGAFAYANTFYFAASAKEQSQGSLDQGDLRKRFFVADFNGDGAADVMQRMIGVGGTTALDQWRLCYSRSDTSVRMDCLRDTQIIVAGTGVSSPAPVMQTNAPYQCSIPASVLPAGASATWVVNYQVTNYGTSVTSTSRADVLDIGPCSSSSAIRWPYDEGGEGGSSYPAIFTNNPTSACNNGVSISLLTGGDTAYPAAGTLGQQRVTVTRAGASIVAGDLIVSHIPLSGTAITSIANLPANVTCKQSSPASVTGPNPAKAEEMIIADFNGDGLADVAAAVDANTKTNGNWQVCLSTGDGGFERFTSVGNRMSTCKTFSGLIFANGDAVTTGDFDGDGRADLLAWQKPEDGPQRWQIAYARGAKSLYNAVADSMAFSVASTLTGQQPNVAKIGSDAKVGDFNGDGISDLSLRISEGGAMRILSPGALAGSAASRARQELITKITDGLGAVSEVDYAPVTDDSVYLSNSTIANTPLAAGEVEARSPMQVVKTLRADNGLDCVQGATNCPWHTTTFKYYGLRASTNGRGMLGFSQRDVSENFGAGAAGVGSTSLTAYNNELAKWWLAGSPRRIVKTHPNAAETNASGGPTHRLSDTTVSYHEPRKTDGFNVYPNLQIIEVFSAGSTQSAWDLDGTVLPTQSTATPTWDTSVVSTTERGYDEDGNVLRTTATTSHGAQTHQKSTVNTYGFRAVADGGATIMRGEWVLGRLTRSEVTHSKSGNAASGGGDIKRVTDFTYYGQPNIGCDTGIGNGATNPTASTATAPKGFVCEEVIEPDYASAGNETLWSRTKHRFDSYGNRVTSTVSFRAPKSQGDLPGYVADSANLGQTTFDSAGRFATSFTNPRGDSEQRTFNAMYGSVVTHVGPNGLLTASTYDAFGRKIRERNFAGNTSGAPLVNDMSTFTQRCSDDDPIPALIGAAACTAGETHRKRVRTSGGATTFTFYDRLQRELRVKTQVFLSDLAATSATANEWTESSVTYDTRGRKASTIKPAGDGTATTNYLFDDLDRVTKETLTGTHGGTITAVTDTFYSGLQSTVIRRASATDPSDRTDQTTVRTTDSQGKLISVTDPALGVTTFVHDAVGNVLFTTAPATSGTTETSTYDIKGRQTSLNSLQAGNFTYDYNGLGELVRQTDGRGWVTVTAFDSLGRKTQRDERQGSDSNSPTFTTTWSYDSGTYCGARTVGKLCAVATSRTGFTGNSANQRNGASSETKYTYDTAGRSERVETAVNLSDPVVPGELGTGPKRFASTTFYDTNGRAESIGSAGGVVFRNHYAVWSGSAWKVTDQNQSTVHWQSTSRFKDGQRKSTTSGGAGAVVTIASLDALGRIDTVKAGVTGNLTLIQNADYNIDSFGNLVARSDVPSGLNITPAETYQYDALNRVTGKNGVANSVATYDARGNVLTKAGQASGGYSYHPTSKRLQSYGGNTYGYDGNGNVETDGRRTIAYAPWNLPWSAQHSTGNAVVWDYDHTHGRTIEQSNVHGTTFFGPGFDLVVPTESTAAAPKVTERTYIPTPDGVLGVITRTSIGNASGGDTVSNKVEYWHKDHLGSLTAITDASAVVQQRFRFDPWGKRECLAANGSVVGCSSSGSSGTEERGFTGHEMLDEIGLIHMNGRLYDPELGRFLQADPIIQNPMDGQNYNRYSYVGNNPLSYSDPSGYSRWTKWRRPVFSLVAAVGVPWLAAQFVFANAAQGAAWALDATTISTVGTQSTAALTSGAQAIANVAGGMAAGGVSGGNIQSAVIGAFTAGAQFGVGEVLGHQTPSLFGPNASVAAQKALAHAAIGCASAAASGGNCRSGAAAAGFSSIAGGSLPFADNLLGRAAIGAVASKLAGGRPEQGALLSAMEYLYNEMGRTKGAQNYGADPRSDHYYVQWTHIASGCSSGGCDIALALASAFSAPGYMLSPLTFSDGGLQVVWIPWLDDTLNNAILASPSAGSHKMPLGVVTQDRQADGSITNTTTPFHGACCGTVNRTALIVNDKLYSLTIGEGRNPPVFAQANQHFGPRTFRALDLQWREAAKAKR